MPNSRQRMAIALASDDAYARYLATAIASILATADKADEIDLYVLDGGLSEESKEKIDRLKAIKECTITYLRVTPERFAQCPALARGAHTNVVTYYRFLLGELLPQVERVLYMDTDVVVCRSLKELWEIDLTGKYAAAVEDLWEHIATYKTKMGMGPQEKYFNAGVVLLNLKLWRQENMTEKLFAARQKLNDMGIFDCGDQDTLNYAFGGKLHWLPWAYNVQQSTWWKREREAWANLAQTYVIHYNGPEKPDAKICGHPLRDVWWKYNAQTDFRANKPWTVPGWTRRLWLWRQTKDETLLRVGGMNVWKVEKKDVWRWKMLGITLIKAYKKEDKLKVRLLGVPLT